MSTDIIAQLLLTGIAVIAFALGVWILNSVSKRLNKVEETIRENDTKIHARIDLIITTRMNKWLEKEKECVTEHMRISMLEEKIKK